MLVKYISKNQFWNILPYWHFSCIQLITFVFKKEPGIEALRPKGRVLPCGSASRPGKDFSFFSFPIACPKGQGFSLKGVLRVEKHPVK